MTLVPDKDGTGYAVTRAHGNTAPFCIPDSYRGVPITTIKSLAFYEDDEVCAIVVSRSIRLIEMDAFFNLPNCKWISIPTSVKEIEFDAVEFFGDNEVKLFVEGISLPAGWDDYWINHSTKATVYFYIPGPDGDKPYPHLWSGVLEDSRVLE